MKDNSLGEKINKHYNDEAKKLRTSPKSTMRDQYIRNAEIVKFKKIMLQLSRQNNKTKILDLGCGNGYTLSKLNNLQSCEFTGIDSNNKMIKIAKKRKLKNVSFKVENILNIKNKKEFYDIVYTERCLINLRTWKLQKQAIENIRKILKKHGCFIMLEGFSDGFDRINKARKAIGLEKIDQPWHNSFFDKKQLSKYLCGRFVDWITKSNEITWDYFLSTYYFGSRVIYPSLISNSNKIVYNNEFLRFFSLMENVGDYGSLQITVLEKI